MFVSDGFEQDKIKIIKKKYKITLRSRATVQLAEMKRQSEFSLLGRV